MLRIVSHIERLLLEHDCVILPGFGGFVSRAIPAVWMGESHRFLPMRRELTFNATLRHTDGLLSGSYMREYGVDYQQARLMLEEDVEGLRDRLERDRRLELGHIGAFSIGEEGQLVFEPGDSAVLNAATYGLQAFTFPALRPLEEVREEAARGSGKGNQDVFYIPVSRKFVRLSVASVAAVALFFIVSTPVKEVSQSAYKASFVPTEMIYTPKEEPAPLVKEIPEVVSEPAAAMPEAVETTVRKEVPAPREEVAARKKMFHIVIASFPTEDQADTYLEGVDRSRLRSAGKVIRGGKYRVYADKFDDRSEAEAYLEEIRKVDTYKDAWLFISR